MLRYTILCHVVFVLQYKELYFTISYAILYLTMPHSIILDYYATVENTIFHDMTLYNIVVYYLHYAMHCKILYSAMQSYIASYYDIISYAMLLDAIPNHII